MADLGINADLIGLPDGRRRLSTPALVIDLEAFEANIAAMAAWAGENGLRLRPHAKTHKAPAVGLAQVAAGAVGNCCATLGEAEAMAAGGMEDLLITSPQVPANKLARVIALNAALPRLAVVVDHPDNADALAGAAGAAGQSVRVLVDLDVGTRRTGVVGLDAAIALVERVLGHDALEFGGIQAYAGHLQHIVDFAERRAEMERDMAFARDTVQALQARGIEVPVVTGGGTGTHRMDAEMGLLSELQCGSYVFMDVDYGIVDIAGAEVCPFRDALFIQTSVISANQPDLAIVDAGLKAMATDGPLPEFTDSAPRGVRYQRKGDEHGAMVYGEANVRMSLGDTVWLRAPHCDPTVNLYDVYHGVRGDVLEAIWPISARGRNA